MGPGGYEYLTDQVQSLEWLSSELTDVDSDIAWQDSLLPNQRTFPVVADVLGGVTDNTFFTERGANTAGNPFLYPGGQGNIYWDVYLFSTGPIGENQQPYQLNLNLIEVAVVVPEAGSAISIGVAMILVAGGLHSRRRA